MRNNLPKYVYPKGRKGYLYFVRGSVCERIHAAPGSAEFAREYARLLSDRAPVKGESWRDLLRIYYASPRYTRLKQSTRQGYRVALHYIEERLGDYRPAKMQRKDVIAVMRANERDPVFANKTLDRLKTLFEVAIDVGWVERNPARGVEKLRYNVRRREAPPPEIIAALREECTGKLRLFLELALGTGQRFGDVRALTWQQIRDGWIHFDQEKTGAKLAIPIPPKLAAELAQWPRGIGPVLGLSRSAIHRGFFEARKRAGAVAYDIHSLRYAAASELAGAGCTDEQIAAITGHSTVAMVARYSGPARQRARAQQAQDQRNRTKTKREF